MDQRSIVGPPRLAVAAGASTPVGLPGAVVWSTTENRLLLWNGVTWQPAKDYLGSVVYTQSTTLQLSDANAFLGFDVTGLHTITVPPNVFPVGQVINGVQLGPGISQFVAGADVTIRALNNILTAYTKGVYSTWTLYQRYQNVWELSGDITNAGPTLIYGFTGFAPQSYFATPPGGGEVGVATTGFGALALFRVNTLSTVGRTILSRANNQSAGWMVYIGTTNILRVYVYNAAGTAISGFQYQLQASDLGKVLAFVFVDTGAGIQTWIGRARLGADVARASYAPWYGPMMLGAIDRSGYMDPAYGIEVMGALTWQGVASPAVVQNMFDVVRQTGDVPTAFLNAPVRGVQGFTPTGNYYSVAGGFTGARTGFAVAVHVRWDVTVTGTTGRLIGKCDGSTKGWRILGYTNGLVYLNCFGDAGASNEVNSPSYTLTYNDYGQPLFFLFVHDGQYLRTFVAGAEKGYREVGSGSAITGYADPTGATFYLGREAGGTTDASAATFFGASMAKRVPTPSEMTAWFDACKAAGRIQPLPEEACRYDVTSDVATGSATAPTTITDRVGSASLTKAGTPTAVSAGATLTHRLSARDANKTAAIQNARAYGARGFAAGAYFTAPTSAVPGALAGFSVRVRLRHDSVPANNSTIFNNTESLSGVTGFSFYYSAGTLRIYVYGVNTDVATYTITTTDYSSPYQVYTIVFTGSVWRLYQGDKQLNTDTSAAYVVSTGTTTGIGNFPAASYPCNAFSIFEVAYGAGVPTQAELTAAFEADTLIIAGKTDHRWVLGDATAGVGATIADLGTGTAAALTRVGTLELTYAVRPQRALTPIVDTVATSTLHQMTRSGSPYVQASDTQRDGRRLLGLLGFDAVTGLATASGAGIGGATGGWWLADVETIYPGTTANRYLVWRASGSTGYTVDVNAAGTALRVIAYDGVGSPLTLTATLTTADHGRPMVIVLRHDGATLKVFLRRAEAASGTLTGFSSSTAAMRIGLTGCENRSWHGLMGGNSVIAHAQVLAIFDAFDATGKLQPLTGVTDHYYDPTLDLLAASEVVPSAIADRVGSDDLTRYGGLRTTSALTPVWGVQGFTANTYLSVVGGPLGALVNGFGVAVHFRVDRAPTSIGMLVDRFPSSGTGGYALVLDGSGNLYFAIRNDAGVQVNSTFIALTAADYGIPLIVYAQLQFPVVQIWLCRAGVVTKYADTTTTGYTPPPSNVGLGVGIRVADGSALYPPTTVSIFDVAISSQWISSADVTTMCETTETTGSLVIPRAQTAWKPDFQAAISPTGTVPAQINDTAGTAHLVRTGNMWPAQLGASRGVADWTPSHCYQTRPGLGLVGSASGFWVTIVFKVPAASSTNRTLWTTYNGTGTFIRVDTNNKVACGMSLGTGTVTYGALMVATIVYTGTVGRLYVNGVKQGSDYTTSYSVSTASMTLGYDLGSGSYAAGDIEIYGVVGGNGYVLTDADAWANYLACAEARAPIALASKTTHLYDVTQDVLAYGSGLLTLIKERISGVEHMVRVGAPLQIAQRTERSFAHEASPILYGLEAFSDTDYYDTQDGEAGDITGWWGYVAFIVTSQNVASASRDLLGKLTATTGWDVRLTGTNTTLMLGWQDSTPTYAYVGSTGISASDVGRIQVFGWAWDASAGYVRTYWKRALSSSTSKNGFTAGTGRFIFGSGYSAGYGATAGISLLGFALGRGIPALGEWQAAYDAVLAKESIVSIAGRTTMLVDVGADVRENGGVLPGVLKDRAGTSHLARTGQPAVTAHYARSWGW